ncbi:MAG: signal recognition particle protein, partial [Candidatus Dormibacteraeota bacterium]|nr:signal recognition particle protein [Candidatus Dormibacteraeota bacterium]
FESLSDRITAALRKISGRGVLRPEDVDTALREVRLALLEADVNFRVVKEFSENVKQRAVGAEVTASLSPAQQVVKIVHEELVRLLGGETEAPGLHYAASPPTVVMLVGLQGAGKTTTSLKLALLARRDGHRPALVGLDLRRPAAVEQLRLLASQENVPFFSGVGPVEEIAKAALAAARTADADVVILDTAGRLQVDIGLMEELKRLKAAVRVSDVLLVADAMTGQEAVNVGTSFDQALGIDGVILTKLDGDARGGAALSLRVATGRPVRFAGVGEKATDLEVFHPDRMASRILGMGDVLSLIEKAEAVMDAETAVRLEKNVRAGRITFDDLLLQMRQLRQMGSMENVVAMLPGGNQLKGQVSGPAAEKEVRKMEAIIQSMTGAERLRPEQIDGSRRRRIARGSGTQVADVNRVLKSREQMEQLMKQLTGGRAGKGTRKLGAGGFDLGGLMGRRSR